VTQDFKPSFAEPTDSQIPVQKFSGVLKSYEPEERTDQRTNRSWMSIKFNFVDIEVIRSTEPYPHPIIPLSISYSDRSNTRWAALAGSARKVMPTVDMDLLVGKRQTWELLPATVRALNNETDTWEPMSRNCWQVVEVEGYGSPETNGNIMDALVDLAHGKTESEFNSEVFNSSTIRNMVGFQSAVESITNRKFFPMMEETGKLTKNDEGVWSKA
jgi:hypothetical protein